MVKISLILLTILVIPYLNAVIFQNMILEGLNASSQMLEWIENRWQIQKYPNFLRSVVMPITSWQVQYLNRIADI